MFELDARVLAIRLRFHLAMPTILCGPCDNFEDLSIRELAEMIRDIEHPSSHVVFDATKPDGTPRKLLNVGRLHDLGWRHQILPNLSLPARA